MNNCHRIVTLLNQLFAEMIQVQMKNIEQKWLKRFGGNCGGIKEEGRRVQAQKSSRNESKWFISLVRWNKLLFIPLFLFFSFLKMYYSTGISFLLHICILFVSIGEQFFTSNNTRFGEFFILLFLLNVQNRS